MLRLRAHKSGGESPQIFHSEDINPEFLTYQEDTELLEIKIAELENILKNVQLIAPPPKENQDVISLGARVVVEVDGQKDELEILNSLEVDPSLGIISNESPVGKALLGHRVGDEVPVRSRIITVYKIKKITYPRR